MDGASLRDRWDRLDARERRWLVAGAVVVAAALAYAFAWHPMTSDLPRAEREAERAQARLSRAQEAVAIAGTRAPAPAREPLDSAIRGAMGRHGIAAADASLDVAGARATLTIPSVRFSAIAGLVDTLAREHAVHVVDATFTARVEAGRVRAELSLSR